MRRPGTVYKKLKEVKYRHLVELYHHYLRKSPENCRYNCKYVFTGDDGKDHEIRLCLLHQKNTESLEAGVFPSLVDVCEQVRQSMHCNAFLPRYSKEDVKAIFEDELKNPNIRAKKYPDICALEWVLERSVVGLPPFTWIQALYFNTKRWMLKNKIL